jgi:hypothetical protein
LELTSTSISTIYQYSEVAILNSCEIVPDNEDFSFQFCSKDGRIVRENLGCVLSSRRKVPIDIESDTESEGAVVLEADRFTEQINI